MGATSVDTGSGTTRTEPEALPCYFLAVWSELVDEPLRASVSSPAKWE